MFEQLPSKPAGAGHGRKRGFAPANAVVVLALAGLISAEHRTPAQVQQSPVPGHTARLHERLVFVRIPVTGQGQAAGVSPREPRWASDLPLGSHIASLDPAEPEQSPRGLRNLTLGFAAAGGPDVSFDGKRMLFVARRTPSDQPQVWEMNIDGTGLRQVITESGPCSAAVYLSTLYTIDADEPVHQIAFCARSGGLRSAGGSQGPGRGSAAVAASLFTCRMDGRRIRRITFNPYGVSNPYLLSDGRLLFSSRRAPHASGTAADAGSALFTVHTDGTGLFVFAPDPEPPHDAGGLGDPDASGPGPPGPARAARWRGMACETPDGWVVFVESTGRDFGRGGALVAVRRTRSLHTRKLVTGDADGFYRSPSPLPDGNLLVSYRPRDDESYGVYIVDPRTGTRIACVVDSPEWHEVDAHVVRPGPVPAGRSSVVEERFDTGFLYCMSAYLSDTDQGRRIAAGRIERLQVFRAIIEPEEARPAGGALPGDSREGEAAISRRRPVREELLGEAPVEPDGSFFLEVPARTPLRLQTLDADGAILEAMRSWIWVMPREARGCIGCHEDRERTPPNRHTLALRQPPRPVGVVRGSE